MYLPALQLSQESQDRPCLLVQSGTYTLLKLKDKRLKAKEIFSIHKNHIKHWFDKKSVGTKSYDVGDLILRWNEAHKEKGKHIKFQYLWIGPYTIKEKLGHNAFKLKPFDGRIDPLPVNGRDLKHYF